MHNQPRKCGLFLLGRVRTTRRRGTATETADTTTAVRATRAEVTIAARLQVSEDRGRFRLLPLLAVILGVNRVKDKVRSSPISARSIIAIDGLF